MGLQTTLKLNVPWGHIAAKTWGNSKDSPVLLVHGTMDNAGTFDRLIEQLPKAFYYVSIDLPGHGFSSKFEPGVPIHYFDYVLAIRYALDALKWDTTYYIGHSIGGQLGFLFTLIYPKRIKKLVLLDGIIPRPIPIKNLISRIQDEHNISVETYKLDKPRFYSKIDVLYALQNLRLSYLNLEAAKALFERAVFKHGDDSYIYSRDSRTKIMIRPPLTIEQYLYLVQYLNVKTLIILTSDPLEGYKELHTMACKILKNFDFVNIVNVEGNHDVHNNYPERISEYVAKFLSFTTSKL